MTSSPVLSVIVLNHNGLRHLQECFMSLLETNYSTFEVIAVDNQSTDKSIEYLERIVAPAFRSHGIPLTLVLSERNLGFPGGNNLGLAVAKGRYVVFLNNDTRVDPNWIRPLVEAAEANPRIGIAQCEIRLYSNPSRLDSAGLQLYLHGGVSVRDHGERTIESKGIREISAAHAGIALMRREMLDSIGSFDLDFFSMKEDDDLSLRAWVTGWRVVLVPGSIVYHKGGQTRIRHGNRANLYYIRRNNLQWILKNLSWPMLLIVLPLHIAFFSIRGLLGHNRRDYYVAWREALKWILRNRTLIWQKRRLIQKLRRVSDFQLLRMGVLGIPSPRAFLQAY